MEEFKSITPTTSVVKISACLEKIFRKIVESREKKIAEHNIKEIEFLKSQCKAENVQLGLMSCQTFVRLVEDGVLEANNVLPMLLSMLPNSSHIQYTTITEGIVSLLLLNLKRKAATLKENEKFQSQFGLKTQQHPMITLLQNPGVNMNDVANKINGICNHHDKQIKEFSIEYLRPVYLYILCNPQTLSDSKTIWTGLLTLSKHNQEAKTLMQEVLSWSKITTSQNCLFTSTLLIEAIEHFLSQKDFKQSIELSVFQILVVNHLVKFGIDPRPSLHCILRVLHSTREHSQSHYNVMLVLLSESLHLLSPSYLPDLLRIISFIVVQENCGHQYILNMCLDGIIQWMSQTAFIPADGLAIAHQIVRKILDVIKGNAATTPIQTKTFESATIRYFHPDIAMAFDLAKLVESYDDSEDKDVYTFVDTLNVKANTTFCQRLHLFLRALFLSREPSVDCWFKIYEVILEIIKVNADIAYDFLMTYIFKLAGEHNPELQMELLRGLPNFAISKDNIPMILNTIRNLCSYNPTFSMDLYLKLWRVESRTYPFLVKLLSLPSKDVKSNKWEFDVAKTYTIREICYEKPTQHGSDLVSHLSDILNTCTDDAGDLPTSLALDAIVALCDSNTVNITSTWRALSSKFRHEKRPRALKSLYKFFAHVPLLQTPTLEFEQLVDEALDQLWLTISRSDTDPEMIREALEALKHYEIGTLLTLKHIPPQFRQDLHVAREYKGPNGREVVDLEQEMIPGEVWVQLLQKIRPECGAAAADLIAHYIYGEINEFRGGLYRLPDGKPEPRKLQGLYPKSPLRAIISYLVNQSRYGDHVAEPIAVTNALRAISKKFPKPIPPVDWSFLHSFFHLSFDTRKYCILIAKNQLLHSGTAKRLLENFLMDFEPNCFEEDLLLLFSLLPEISNGVSLTILKNFAEKVAVYCFKESQLAGFNEGCLFEKFMDSVKYIFMGKCEIPEVLDIFTLIVERYMDSMDVDSKLFQRYTEAVAVLPNNAIDGLTLPSNWWETPIGKLKKATIIRSYLVLYNGNISNPLKWLNPIIDAYATRKEDQLFFFRHLTSVLYAFNSDEQSCNWIMEMFIQIQALLAESSNKEKLEKVLYLLDIFILSVDVLSGCAVLLGNLDVVATQRNERFQIFPESMQFLCDHIFWKDQEAKIYEFLYNLYKNPAIPEIYASIFKDAIVCSRNKPYFDAKGIWTKYVGMRK
ncbi:focadhesin [Musca domestica]|uniref:Focadhesin n=1 Tax=Musca domestica TaxID=7370 RepID=A0A1I8N8B6_MUSDO|nr:focadhesin [Musca domestica]XP_005181861.1 focadhesin [Musca domestica]XP_011291800.1 focadhesin [Musca domestica]XP_011291803.1 focadhesin [Musca domestica]XP_058981747.1 focadhesin [Musca domestica]